MTRRENQKNLMEEQSLSKEKMAQVLRNYYGKVLTEEDIPAPSLDTRVSFEDFVEAQVELVASDLCDITKRNNKIACLLHGTVEQPTNYDWIREEKERLKGKTKVFVGFCVDGRIKRILFGLSVNTWEVPAGEIVAQKKSDGTIIPESAELKTSLSSLAEKDEEVLELFFAHRDSKHESHGCAAIGLVLKALRLTEEDIRIARAEGRDEEIDELLKMKAQREAILSKEDIKTILEASTPEAANLILLERKSIKAITNFLNLERVRFGREPQDIVGIAAYYDTSNKGITFNPLLEGEGKSLSTTELLQDYMDEITDKVSGIARFGRYAGEESITPDNLLEFAQDHLDITKILLRAEAGGQNNLLITVEDYVDKGFQSEKNGKVIDLTDSQKQALRFYFVKTVALQYLKGLTGADDHKEGYMSAAVGSEFAGKYDTEQMFGSSPADIETLIKQIEIELSVMRGHRSEIERPIVLVSTPVKRHVLENRHNGEAKSYQNAVANNLRIYDRIIRHKGLKKEVTPVGVLIDEDTREILEILDHSSSI